MVRLENWPMLLGRYLKETKDKPFKWGENDCILFAAKGLEAITGQNLYAEYVYETEDQAKEILENHNGLAGLISKHLGPGHRNFKKAHRGDLVMMKLPQPTLGIVDDSGQRIAAISQDGHVRLPLNKAWRVWGY